MKNIKTNATEIFNFYNLRNICILHGHVFVMTYRQQFCMICSILMFSGIVYMEINIMIDENLILFKHCLTATSQI